MWFRKESAQSYDRTGHMINWGILRPRDICIRIQNLVNYASRIQEIKTTKQKLKRNNLQGFPREKGNCIASVVQMSGAGVICILTFVSKDDSVIRKGTH